MRNLRHRDRLWGDLTLTDYDVLDSTIAEHLVMCTLSQLLLVSPAHRTVFSLSHAHARFKDGASCAQSFLCAL